MEIIENELLSKHTTYKIGGPARYFIEPQNLQELQDALRWATEHRLTIGVLSNGSNILVSDKGFDGLVIKLKQNFRHIEIEDTRVKVGAGVGLHQLIEYLAEKSFGGFEKLACVPGSVAGAIVMNAGAYGVSFGNSVLDVTVVNRKGSVTVLPQKAINFSYRHSLFQERDDLIIVAATLQVVKKEQAELYATIEEIKEKRKRHPQQPSAGSVFRNPPGKYAGQVIESLGLKGVQYGQAQISPLHANFIVNLGGAKASDVFHLINLVKKKALEQGIEMNTEVKLWGDFEDLD